MIPKTIFVLEGTEGVERCFEYITIAASTEVENLSNVQRLIEMGNHLYDQNLPIPKELAHFSEYIGHCYFFRNKNVPWY